MLCYFRRLNIPFMPESAVLLFWHKKPPVQLCRDCTGGRLKFD